MNPKDLNMNNLLLFAAGCLMLTSSSLTAVAKSLGMGYTGTAHPQESTSGNFNPANIAFLGNRLDFEAGTFYYNGKTHIYQDPLSSQNGVRTNTQAKWLPVGMFGVNKWISNDFVVNLSTDAVRSFKGTYNKGFPRIGHGKFSKEYIIPYVVPGIAWKINCQHSIGISVPMVIPRVKINGVQYLAFDSVHPHHVSNKGYDWSFGAALRVGYYYQHAENFSFGAMFKTPLLAASHFKKYQGLFPRRGLMEDPAIARIGVRYQWNCCNLTFDFEETFYRNTKSLGGSPRNKGKYGSSHGPGLGWANQYRLLFGADWQFNDQWVGRVGYQYFSPVLHKSNFEINLAGQLFLQKHILNTGFSWECGMWEFSWAFAYIFQEKLKSNRSDLLGGGYAEVYHRYILTILGAGINF